MSFAGVIAIDGPSGSGKSSVSREVARRLGFRYLDTGAMYRAACWAAIDAGLDLTDQAKVGDYVRSLEIFLATDPDEQLVVVRGVEVTEAIRKSWISHEVSAVATNLAVRAELVARQRNVIAGGRWVIEGRDTTTVVAPDAEVRILITADPELRVARRTAELHVIVDQDTMEITRSQITDRDDKDSAVVEFHTAADGVVFIDSSDLTLEQTVTTVLNVVNEAAMNSSNR